MEATQKTAPIFTSRDDLIAWIGTGLGDIAVKHLELICAPNHPGHIQCFIDFNDANVHQARSRLGGQIFGFDTLVLDLPVAPDFGCPRLHGEARGPRTQCMCEPR